MKSYLGIEFGSTRIKAVTIDEAFQTIDTSSYGWKSDLKNGIWTYSLEEAWKGLKAVLSKLSLRDVSAVGISGMMHGYLAFDKDWNLLVPFRTWQNTITAQAASKLTALFGINIPQRWSIAHLYQAILNEEAHVPQIAHLTTLSGYIHYLLTGVNALGIGEASGMFPINNACTDYDEVMIQQFDALLQEKKLPFRLRQLLPEVRCAGTPCGRLSTDGAARLNNLLPVGIPFAPPEGDAGTGMTATNAVAPRTGNISAGTSIFSMVVLECPLQKVHPEIDVVTTPDGHPVAMVHCNNCTNDSNAWFSLIGEAVQLFGASVDTNTLFSKLYQKSLEAEPDCGGILSCNYLAGESVTHFDKGCPLLLRKPGSHFTLANFLRAQLYSSIATLHIGMELLAQDGISIDRLTVHGGFVKTAGVGQRYLAASCGVPITLLETAGEGGPYGMALLAGYMLDGNGISLPTYLSQNVFAGSSHVTYTPDRDDTEGFLHYMENYTALLEIERAAIALF